MTWIGRVRAARQRESIQRRSALYATDLAEADRAREQLDRLNAMWDRTTRTVPYWRDHRPGLPGRFASLEEFAEAVPGIDKGLLQRESGSLQSGERPADFQRITGGSTAEPIQIPAWSSELAETSPDMWTARGWYGIDPASRLFLLWGHSHLLGTGLSGRLRGAQRQLYDRLLGYHRFSAYDLSPANLRRGASAAIRFRPEYIIGYSVALDAFARAAEGMREELRALGVRVVVAAAEGFPSEDSEARISDLFDCPVAMEYGAVETNLVGHTHPSGGYQAFWGSYLVEIEEEDGRFPIRVTSLFPRAVPLIRYAIGDELEPLAGEPRIGVGRFDRVRGRSNAFVEIEDGARIHSEAFTHAIRSCAGVLSYQVVQEGASLRLRYLANGPLDHTAIEGVRDRLTKVHPSLREMTIERATALEQTIAGKTPMILRRAQPETPRQAAGADAGMER